MMYYDVRCYGVGSYGVGSYGVGGYVKDVRGDIMEGDGAGTEI